ncbi:poly(A) RNA polymerase, mitochondrial-like [Sitodiplosis mosellana]|uniref:poly(A) RNA polymerase, mitochondrial-like n=1 Tax=Sitodiplosis mosellana TaxID=263140 RepID=UPI002444B857|nr:poly(A) RNA polymerase, mitochondrial-like [Sitodiplosis mosellana]
MFVIFFLFDNSHNLNGRQCVKTNNIFDQQHKNFAKNMLKYQLNLNKISNTFQYGLSHQIQIQIRNRHDAKTTPNTQTSFQNEVRKRQAQAKRSIFIETPGDSNTDNELAACCSQIGPINSIFRLDAEAKSHFLVEFKHPETAKDVIRSAYHPGNHFIDGKVRAKGRFLTFSSTGDSATKPKKINYNFKRETGIINPESILKQMRDEKTIDDQIMKLFKVNRLSDLSSRLRFLTALQIEEAISGVFHEAQVLPFGSSINGFGRMQSDLDMILVSYGNRTWKGQLKSMELGTSEDMARYTVRNNLYVVSTMARHWLQGVSEVQPILNARVPIIKYIHTLTNLECDLSMGNFSGYQMSEIFYTFGEMDERVRPLAFFIRAWAKEFDILQPFPAGLSNFMVTCLVIFFLQRLQKPILPPSDDIISLQESGENIQLITDTKKLNFKTENTSTLAELLVEFFEYYSSFDYSNDAASIATGTIKANISSDSMFIYNPLDHGLNVSRNVTDFELNQFVDKCRMSRDALTKSSLDAVELLEFYSKNMSREKIDSFVNNMMKQKSSENSKKSGKFNVKTLMKS